MDALSEVVSQWLSGREVDDDLVVLGLRMIWWGRIGKLLAFLGGGTIILDIIGPERVMEWERARRMVAPRLTRALHSLAVSIVFLIVSLLAPSLIIGNELTSLQVVPVAVVAVITFLSFAGRALARGVARLLRAGTGAKVLRICAAAVLSVGFLLDFATS